MTDNPRPPGPQGPEDVGPVPPVPPGWSPVQPPPAGPPPAPDAGQGWQGQGWQGQGWQAQGWQGQGWAPPAPRPGIIPLRPLGVGELLDGAISTLRTHPRAVLGLSAVVAALTQLVEVPLAWLLLGDLAEVADVSGGPGGSTATVGPEDLLGPGQLATVGVSLVVTLVASTFLTGILTVVVSRAVLGQRVTAGEAWARARGRLPALLAVTVLTVLVVLCATALPLLPALVLGLSGAAEEAVLGVGALGLLSGLVLGAWLYVRFALAAPAAVLEGRPALAAMGRSGRLVAGAWWRTFGLVLLVLVIGGVLSSILQVPFAVLATVLADAGDVSTAALVPLLVAAVGTVLASAITWPFSAAATVLVYVDRRMRREGLDLELARAAGTAGTTGPTPR